MPGVPSYRGCEACRKQKKKCDQNKPACSRCTRLDIPCVGCGQRRYKFKNQTLSPMSRGLSQSASVRAMATMPVPSPLINSTTRVAGGLVWALGVTDIRYELSIYGDFLQDIPRRLGRNAALDSSVAALTTSFEAIHVLHKPPEVFNKYARALWSLRRCLDDPVEAQSPETLCAIWMIVICQGWIGSQDDQQVCHGEAMSHLLTAAMSRNWQGSFELQLARTLSVIVILESFYNSRIVLDHRLWDTIKDKRSQKPDAVHHRANNLEPCHLAKTAELFRDPQMQFDEVQSRYQSIRNDCDVLEALLSQTPMTRAAGGILTSDLAPPAKRLHVRQQTGHGILIMIALALNAVLYTHKPLGVDLALLAVEADELIDQAINLAEKAMQYRPLAASATPMCLVVAWAVTDDVLKQERLQQLLDEYQQDFASVRWREQAFKMKTRLRGIARGVAEPDPIAIVIT
ncbi:hypothetical protein N0V93_000098 [Gnomoniopsis smithogilvyi]|uniref:Zn(2)-C6 fungal-type domain-containing protein n=1 Tax=Gnomoniopsis smithogilvyi TaxID=1191159 RepID=A0A9W9D0F4_9PEZI|nr:hypothetical protein N0V93_000098 [Gnomoniopsis smithogilvyi]